jgi:hypothetical protein
MTDDDRRPIEREGIDTQEYKADDPAPSASAEEAFEALRKTVEDLASDLVREMTTIRKGVEAALDAQEKFQQPIDYSEDLAQLAKNQVLITQHLEALGKSPILKNGPEHYARALERSGESLVKTAAQQFQYESRDFQRVARELAGHVESARERHIQNRTLWGVGVAGIVAGALLLLLLPRFLPFSADSHVAGLVMGNDRLSAGRAMIQSAERDITTGGWVYETNRAAIDKCIADMFQTKKKQRCALILPVAE